MSAFDVADLGDSSESEDEDYVPSADEIDRDASDCGGDAGSDLQGPTATTSERRKGKASPHRKRKGGIRLDSDEEDPSHESATKNAAVGRDKAGSNGVNDRDDNARESEGVTFSAQERAKADSLWSEFLRDANDVPKKQATAAADACQASTSSASAQDDARGSGNLARNVRLQEKPSREDGINGALCKKAGSLALLASRRLQAWSYSLERLE